MHFNQFALLQFLLNKHRFSATVRSFLDHSSCRGLVAGTCVFLLFFRSRRRLSYVHCLHVPTSRIVFVNKVFGRSIFRLPRPAILFLPNIWLAPHRIKI